MGGNVSIEQLKRMQEESRLRQSQQNSLIINRRRKINSVPRTESFFIRDKKIVIEKKELPFKRPPAVYSNRKIEL